MLSTHTHRRTFAGLMIVLLGFLSTDSFGAMTRHVITTADDGTPGTLRYEIAHSATGDTIDFLLLDCPCKITLTSGAISLYLPITIVGLGSTQLTISGNNNDRIFYIAAAGTTKISGMQLRDGIQAGGGAIAAFGDVALSDIAFRHNLSFGTNGTDSFLGNGGALYVDLTSSVSITAVIFEDNSAGPENYGGAITSFGSLQITDSTFVHNDANMCGAISMSGNGSIENSTFTGNRTIGDAVGPGSGSGGGICAWIGDISIGNSTVVNNAADREGGGIASPLGVTLANTVVANNAAPTGPDISGRVLSLGYNLVSNRSGSLGYQKFTCGPSDSFPADLPELDPNLSPLHVTSNGLPVLTPNPGSPLIDAISIGGGLCDGRNVPSMDARGILRPYGAKADIGAVEFVPNDDRIFCDGLEGVACAALH